MRTMHLLVAVISSAMLLSAPGPGFGAMKKKGIDSGAAAPGRTVNVRAGTTIECKGGKNYHVTTGTGGGSCQIRYKSDGATVSSVTCSDGDNEAGASCSEGCRGSTGAGDCTRQ
jgi:hypothetical protein